MIEQFTYIGLGILELTILDSIGSILSRKLNFNYALLIVVSISIYSLTSINVAIIGNNTNGIIAGCILGLFDATIGVLIAKKFKANTGDLKDFEWEVKPNTVFGLSIFAGVISIISIYAYK